MFLGQASWSHVFAQAQHEPVYEVLQQGANEKPEKKNNKVQIDLKHLINRHIIQFVHFEAIYIYFFYHLLLNLNKEQSHVIAGKKKPNYFLVQTQLQQEVLLASTALHAMYEMKSSLFSINVASSAGILFV